MLFFLFITSTPFLAPKVARHYFKKCKNYHMFGNISLQAKDMTVSAMPYTYKVVDLFLIQKTST